MFQVQYAILLGKLKRKVQTNPDWVQAKFHANRVVFTESVCGLLRAMAVGSRICFVSPVIRGDIRSVAEQLSFFSSGISCTTRRSRTQKCPCYAMWTRLSCWSDAGCLQCWVVCRAGRSWREVLVPSRPARSAPKAILERYARLAGTDMRQDNITVCRSDASINTLYGSTYFFTSKNCIGARQSYCLQVYRDILYVAYRLIVSTWSRVALLQFCQHPKQNTARVGPPRRAVCQQDR